jgi:DNA-binding MarR family transcriptional regulator
MRCYSLFRAARLEAYGVTGYQYLYLTNICRAPGVSQDELAEKLIFNKSSVARQLATLEQNGFVERRRNEKDKRELLVFPTEKALRVLPVIDKAVADFREKIGEGFSENEWEELERLLKRVQENAKSAIEEK